MRDTGSDREILRPEDVARMLGVPRSSVYSYARSGTLPAIKIGRHVRFVREDVERRLGELGRACVGRV